MTLHVVYGSNIDQSLQNINMSSLKQCLVSGARIAAYNFTTERLIATSKAPINSSSNAHSSDTNNSIFTKCTKWSIFLCVVSYDASRHATHCNVVRLPLRRDSFY